MWVLQWDHYRNHDMQLLPSFVLRGFMTLWNRILFWDTMDCTRTTQRAVAARASSTAWEGALLQVVPRPATPQPCPPGAAPALPVWGRVGAQLMFAGHSHYIPIPTHTNTQPHPHPHPPYPHKQMLSHSPDQWVPPPVHSLSCPQWLVCWSQPVRSEGAAEPPALCGAGMLHPWVVFEEQTRSLCRACTIPKEKRYE